MKRPVIAVFGSSTPPPLSPAYQAAYELGRGIAAAGWVLCNGGYGGTMAAACQGAVEAGGHTIGVTCDAFEGRCVNPHVRQEISTSSLLHRLDTLVHLGDAFVALPGGTGTLLELALVWEMINKRLLGRQPPLILLTEFWTPLTPLIRTEQPDALEPCVAPTIADALRILAAHFGSARPSGR